MKINTVIFTGSTNTQFDWTNSKTSIGLAAVGVSDITAFKAAGTTPNGTSITGKVIVTPKINGCIGSSTSFDLIFVASKSIVCFPFPLTGWAIIYEILALLSALIDKAWTVFLDWINMSISLIIKRDVKSLFLLRENW